MRRAGLLLALLPVLAIAADRFQQTAPGVTNEKVADPQWWKLLGDPLLDRLIDRAANANLDLRTAGSRIAEARAAVGVAKSGLLPSLDGSGSVSQLRGGAAQGITRLNTGGSGGSFVSPFETSLFQTGFDARWEIDLFGGLRKNRQAAVADALAAEAQRHDVLVTVQAEVARNYVELRGTDRQLDVARRNVETQRDTLELTRVRAEAGLATELDVERQSSQLALTLAAIPSLEAERARSAHRLAVLLGEEPGALHAELAQTAPLPLVPPQLPVGLPSDLLERRPDIRQAKAEVAAANARVGVARADLFPKFVISGLSGRQATNAGGLTLGAGNFFSVGPGIQLPLFTGGRIRSNIAAQDARLQQALRRYDGEVLAALEETENALVTLDREQRRKEQLAAAVASSRRAVELSQELYTRGLSDFLSVLEAQRTQYSAEAELARSETSVVQQVVALYKTLGGGWQP